MLTAVGCMVIIAWFLQGLVECSCNTQVSSLKLLGAVIWQLNTTDPDIAMSDIHTLLT